ncbi:MAG: DUF2325 domain-containing protein [Gammaproteobacteria bacterium]|nr:DUF2325 domain-containing protein [Gammaproteobacteria bacterium]
MFHPQPPKSVLRIDASAGFAFPGTGPLVNIAEPRRRKLWDFSPSLHCSIIGTCLTLPALRKVVGKSLGPAMIANQSDHEIHKEGVRLAAVSGGAGKLLQKALETEHAAAIRRFETAVTSADILALWREARAAGDVAGGYWAALTHPATDTTTLRQLFGEVHMLSHLVGAANRADIRRLADLEQENVRLSEKVERQESRLRSMVTERDARIARLQAALAEPAPATQTSDDRHGEVEELRALVTGLRQKLDRESARRQKLETRQSQLQDDARTAGEERDAAVNAKTRLAEELTALEDYMQAQRADAAQAAAVPMLAGRTLLYVGGRLDTLAAIKDAVAATGAVLLHHDGGQDEAASLLPSLIGRADVVAFPVDCISHSAMFIVKRLCKQAEKPFVPLPSSGLAGVLRLLKAWPRPAAIDA